MTDPFAKAHLARIQEAAAADREASELTRDDAKHLRRLVADQAGLMGTLVQRVEALTCMVRDLVNAALTSDVREVVHELHKVRANRDEWAVMARSHAVELARYVELYGPLEVDTNGGEGPQ